MTESELIAREKLYEALSNSPSLQTNPQLAISIGVNRTIILQQIMYWLKKNEERGINNFNGCYWCYNSVSEWKANDFPFFSESTIDRCIDDLTKAGILIASKTRENGKVVKWLTVDYKAILKYQNGERQIEKHSRDLSGKKSKNESKIVNLTNKKEHEEVSFTKQIRQSDEIEIVKLTNINSSIRPSKNSQIDESDLVNQTKTDIFYNIYNNTSTENTTKNTNRDYGTEITKKEEEKEEVDANASMSSGQEETVPYIILPDTEESKPHPADDKFHRNKIERMIDSCEVRARRELNIGSRTANTLRDCMNYFCKTYEKRTGCIHGYICGEAFLKIVDFMFYEFQKGRKDFYSNAKDEIDKFFDEHGLDCKNCQMTLFVNERRTA